MSDNDMLPAHPDYQAIMLGLLDAKPFPSVLIDGRARVLVANALAREKLAACDAIPSIADGQFRLPLAGRQKARLVPLLEELRNDPTGKRRHVVSLETEPDNFWLVLERLDGSAEAYLASVRCLGDLQCRTPDELGVYLDLTPSESSMVSALIAADSIVDYATAHDRQPSTIRWHMRNALLKTGCRSQRELINLAVLLVI